MRTRGCAWGRCGEYYAAQVWMVPPSLVSATAGLDSFSEGCKLRTPTYPPPLFCFCLINDEILLS